MADPTHLHIYQCPNDSTIAASAVRITTPLLCVLCARHMVYRWSDPITTEAQRDIAAHGLMFNPFVPRAPLKCSWCRAVTQDASRVVLRGIGTFCSEACATLGRDQHERFMQKLADERAAEERRSQPWVK